jgi:glycosyltransferase involved in cell wall biosynthesis
MDSTSKPLISVALCTYNGARYLEAQLRSIQQQSWTNLEIVAVDDGSTDGTRELLRAAAAQDVRLRVFFNEENLGFRRNFDKALSLCKGGLIAPCDQDDVWETDKLEKLMGHLGDHQLVYCDSALIDEQGRSLNVRISQCVRMYQGNDPAAFVMVNCVSGHALLCRREVLDRALPMPPVKFHDWWLAFVACSMGSIAYLHEPLVHYRQHAAAQTDIRGASRKGRPSDKVVAYAETRDWLKYLSELKSPHQAWFVELHRLWVARAQQWICPGLVRHLAQRGATVVFATRHQSFSRLAFRMFWGLKTKSLMNPARYPQHSLGLLFHDDRD